MSARAIVVGGMLVLVVCGLGYLIHHVVKLTSLVNGGMPVVVFATVVGLVLVVNPRKLWRPLGGAELAVILAMGVCVCGYTASAYFRYLGGLVTIPVHALQTRGNWQATGVFSYVPGHVGLLAPGQLRSPGGLAREVVAQQGRDTTAGRLWREADDDERRVWREAAEAGDAAAEAMRGRLTAIVNRAMVSASFAGGGTMSNARQQLQRDLGDFITAPPAGEGVLLNDGVYGPPVEAVLFGRPGEGLPSVRDVPWSAWRPIIVRWVGLMAVMVLIALCLAVIVRPQWAQHERLAFPIVRFAELMFAPGRGRADGLPHVAQHRLFWIGLVGVSLLHAINGLHAWFPSLPRILLTLDLSGLQVLFPNASRTWQAVGAFRPRIDLTVIGFAFFLPGAIALTFGVTNYLYLMMASMLVVRGVELYGGRSGAGPTDLISFGAMLGLVAALLYTGRRYYGAVLARAALLPMRSEAPPSAAWACRALVVLLPLAVLHLTGAGMTPVLAVLAIGVMLLAWLVNARVLAETGRFRMGSCIMPVGVGAAVFGFEAMGPTQVLLLTMVGVIFVTDLWETPMTYMLTGLEATRREGVRQGRMAWGLAATALVGLAVATAATLAVQHRYGLITIIDRDANGRAVRPMELAAQVAGELSTTGNLVASVEASSWQRLAMMRPDGTMLAWVAVGLAGFAVLSIARLRVPWWPLHPILFVLLGNWGVATYGFSFLLGWMIKATVVNVGGARAYHNLIPLMCGLIAGGLASAALWLAVGLTYFVTTGLTPPSYNVFGQ